MPERPVHQKLAFWLLILIIGVFISSFFTKGPFSGVTGKVLGVSWPTIKMTSSFSFDFGRSGLEEIIQNDLVDQKGYFAVYIENLASGETFSLNANETFPAASLYKLFLLSAVLKEVESGKIRLDDTLTTNIQHLISVYGDVDFGYENQQGNVSYTVDEAMQRVGRISDNFASIILTERVGWEKAQEVAASIGAKNTYIKSPTTTTAQDIGLFMKKMYENDVVSPAVSRNLVEYLSLSQLNDRLPKYLPEGVKIVHKTGELSRLRHDAGIVYLEGQPYVIVLMSKDLQYEDAGRELLAKISKDVYEYFKNK